MATMVAGKAPSAAQLALVRTVAGEREVSSWGATATARIAYLDTKLKLRNPSSRQVSEMIVWLKKHPKAVTAIDTDEVAPAKPMQLSLNNLRESVQPKEEVFDPHTLSIGVYRRDSEIYIVKPNKEKSRMYALRMYSTPNRVTESGDIVQFDFAYDKGAIWKLRPEHKVTQAEAEALSVRHGRCIICNAKLKAAVSVKRMMGRVCYSRQGLS